MLLILTYSTPDFYHKWETQRTTQEGGKTSRGTRPSMPGPIGCPQVGVWQLSLPAVTCSALPHIFPQRGQCSEDYGDAPHSLGVGMGVTPLCTSPMQPAFPPGCRGHFCALWWVLVSSG